MAQAHEDGGQDQQHAHGRSDRDVLGNHLAEDDVAEENNDECGGEADHVAGRLGRAQALERRLDEVGDRGLGDDAEGRGRDRHAELADRQHEGDVLQRVQSCGRAARALIRGHGDGETNSHAHSDTSSSSVSGAGVIAT